MSEFGESEEYRGYTIDYIDYPELSYYLFVISISQKGYNFNITNGCESSLNLARIRARHEIDYLISITSNEPSTNQ